MNTHCFRCKKGMNSWDDDCLMGDEWQTICKKCHKLIDTGNLPCKSCGSKIPAEEVVILNGDTVVETCGKCRAEAGEP